MIFFCSFWKWLFSQRCFHAVKLDVEKDNVVSTLSNVVHINAEIRNVDSTLFDVVNCNVEIHNVVSTLIWCCPTSQRHINQKTTLKQRWNVCWELCCNFHSKYYLYRCFILFRFVYCQRFISDSLKSILSSQNSIFLSYAWTSTSPEGYQSSREHHVVENAMCLALGGALPFS